MIRQPMEFFGWLMLFKLSLVWGGSFFFTGFAVAEMLVLAILVWRYGAVCFHETGGSCDAGGKLDLAGLFPNGVTERCHPFRPDHLGVGLC